jgi:hypothetical protein
VRAVPPALRLPSRPCPCHNFIFRKVTPRLVHYPLHLCAAAVMAVKPLLLRGRAAAPLSPRVALTLTRARCSLGAHTGRDGASPRASGSTRPSPGGTLRGTGG